MKIYSNTVYVTVNAKVLANVLVYVYDLNSGQGISGATVTLSGPANLTQTTDSNGDTTFFSIPIGFYTISATAQNYNSSSTQVGVQGDTSVRIGLKYTGISTQYLSYTSQVVSGEGKVTPYSYINVSSATFTAIPYGDYKFGSWSLVYNGHVIAADLPQNPITLISSDICQAHNIPCNSTIVVQAAFTNAKYP